MAKRPAKKQKAAPTTATQSRSPNKPVLALAIVGMVITGYLTGAAWWDSAPAFCAQGSSCDLIQGSRWSTVLGLPLALWGFLTYALIAFFAYTPMSRLQRWQRLWYVSLFGLAISLYLTFVGLFALNAVCVWCLASLAILSAIFALTVSRKPPSAPGMPWWNWLLNSGIVVLVAVGGLHIYYNYSHVFRPPQDPRLEALAQHLEETGAKYYGASWCVNCQQQSALFGDAADELPYIECSPGGRSGRVAFACVQQNIESYPTWIIDGERFVGVIQPQELARRSGFDWENAGEGLQENGAN
jgi:uncharacterized membrane protein